MSNYGYIEFLKNAINNYINIIQDNDSTLIVYCLDIPTYTQINQYLKNKTNTNIITKLQDINLLKEASFNSPDFFQITSIKFNIIMRSLIDHQIIHFFDPDVYFFSNPKNIILQYIESNDVVFQQDSPRSHGHDLYSNYVCTGNFTIKYNNKSKIFLQTLIDISALSSYQNDQEILYSYLNTKGDNIKAYTEADLEIYDPILFQNGFDAFQSHFHTNDKKICIHANHMVGKNTKKTALQSINAWTLSH